MKVQINEITLDGADRKVCFSPGLNIITGPIASGKTTLIRYIRFLLGGSLGHPPREARTTVTNLIGSVELVNEQFCIARPAVTTPTAKVEIAGRNETWRLPATSSPDRNTYVNWLLRKLDLPRIDVPSAPTKPDSDTTPVSINDYFLYSYLAQEELGVSIFGHRETHKNIKRKYVFQLTYGIYDLNTARIQERLREVQGKLKELGSRRELFDSYFGGTRFESKQQIELELHEATSDLEIVEAETVDLASQPKNVSETDVLRSKIASLERRADQLRSSLELEKQSLRNLRELTNQLEAQSERLTRSIVSDKHLSDIEFVVCPRCGTKVESSKSDESTCYLCHQEPSIEHSRDVLISEQGSVEQELKEAQALSREREMRSEQLRKELENTKTELSRVRDELDFQTESFVSQQATTIAANAARRAQLATRITHLRDYLDVLHRIDKSDDLIATLTGQKEELAQELATSMENSEASRKKLRHLKRRFNEILEQLKPPRFGEETWSDIDEQTYLPVYFGRTFSEVSSPGLGTLINIAHALAHHLTAIELNLKLPQILIIDGLSEHLGKEGLDPERLLAAYDLLIDTSDKFPELQILLVDNEIPENARPYVRLELSEDNRLIRV